MREFQGRSGGLYRLSPAAKLLYASFNLTMVLAFGTSVALYWDSMGIALGDTAVYWLGDSGDPNAMTMQIEKSPRYLLDLTHQHLFSMPIVTLVLAHLFLLARGGRWKTWVVLSAPILLVAHVAGPWIVRFGGAAFAWWMPLTAIPFVVVHLFMALWPLPDLFRREDG